MNVAKDLQKDTPRSHNVLMQETLHLNHLALETKLAPVSGFTGASEQLPKPCDQGTVVSAQATSCTLHVRWTLG